VLKNYDPCTPFPIFPENNPPPSTTFLGRPKKIFRTSTLQLLSKDFILIFHTKFRYLAQKNRYLVLCAEIFNTKKWLGPNLLKILHGPPLWLRLTFDDPPLQPYSKIVTHPPIFPSPPPLLLYDRSLNACKHSKQYYILLVLSITNSCTIHLYVDSTNYLKFVLTVPHASWSIYIILLNC
jgi:hypothetical protein